MSVELVVAASSKQTGALLATALGERGVSLSRPARCRVSYGVLLDDTIPTLNAKAGAGDKYDQLVRIREAGIKVPRIYLPDDNPDQFPLLGRRRQHMGGRDIRMVLQPEELPWRSASGSEFFVEYVPWRAEYRSWVFQGKHLGTYRKVMAHPEQYKRLGANRKNGFAFELVRKDDIPREAVQSAIGAVNALDLDFGAVDVLQGKDEVFYTLEVNTAPGVQSETRQVLRALARRIQKWSEQYAGVS
jgi:hypothetical protein